MFNGNVKRSSVVILLVAVICVVGAVGVMSAGYRDMNVANWVRERNPDNLLDYTMPVEDKMIAQGVILNIEQDGTIKIKGNVPLKLNSNGNPTYIQLSYGLDKVLLPAGKYTLSCEGGRDGYAVVCGQYKDAEGKTKDWGGYTTQSTMLFTEPTEVTFQVRILKDGPVNLTLRPILNKGVNPKDYYVLKSVGE